MQESHEDYFTNSISPKRECDEVRDEDSKADIVADKKEEISEEFYKTEHDKELSKQRSCRYRENKRIAKETVKYTQNEPDNRDKIERARELSRQRSQRYRDNCRRKRLSGQNHQESQSQTQERDDRNQYQQYPTAAILRRDEDHQRRLPGDRVNEAYVLVNGLPPAPPPKRPTPRDEYDLYGEQIACKLRKMDEFTRINTQHRINCVVHEAEMKLLNEKYGRSDPLSPILFLQSPSRARSSSPHSSSHVEVNDITYETKLAVSSIGIKPDAT